ncbi:hypothetical protein L218DRAFT_948162 [Marasmius fiardii PR-910]|nr:hypothetical protein L218DRAFT_948162 [Marasmius fiardii PR-910]
MGIFEKLSIPFIGTRSETGKKREIYGIFTATCSWAAFSPRSLDIVWADDFRTKRRDLGTTQWQYLTLRERWRTPGWKIACWDEKREKSGLTLTARSGRLLNDDATDRSNEPTDVAHHDSRRVQSKC